MSFLKLQQSKGKNETFSVCFDWESTFKKIKLVDITPVAIQK